MTSRPGSDPPRCDAQNAHDSGGWRPYSHYSLYNGGDYITETLDSLADQTVPLHEVVIIDDGSTDSGPLLARKHRIGARVITQENAGIAIARNRGAFKATSRFVTFLDQDDLWMRTRHERLIAYLAANPACRALATSETRFFLEQDRSKLAALNEQQHRHAIPVAGPAALATLRAQRDFLDGLPAVQRIVTTRELLLGTIGVTCSNVVERELFFAAGGCVAMARTMDDGWARLTSHASRHSRCLTSHR